ncbi:Uncharacterised protein [Burkholderia pseudomallei]|nr:Uncharacterised protein [Burkholderia pseudomallei]
MLELSAEQVAGLAQIGSRGGGRGRPFPHALPRMPEGGGQERRDDGRTRMMTPPNIEAHFEMRRQQITLPARLFAVVDALLFAEASDAPPLRRANYSIALFDRTPDASLAEHGPWLIDYALAPGPIRRVLAELAAGPVGMSWLISAYPFERLAAELREHLDVRLPDGRTALLRFYDARIMPDIARVMRDAQRSHFFVATYDWLVEIDGRLTGVHPHA